MKHDYKTLLDTVLEIEGLLMVQIDRKEEHSDHIDDLIARKIACLNGVFDGENSGIAPDDNAIAESAFEEETAMADEPALPDTTTSVAIEQAVEADQEEPKESALTLDERLARQRAKDIYKAFTLNDKFRFRRELFRGSQSEFDEALEVIAGMNSIDEAREYFIDDLCWDPANEDVKAFMDIIAKHF